MRDGNSGRVGAVPHAFDVPRLGWLRVTTPIATDTVQTSGAGGTGSQSPVLVVRREFPAGATVYYQYRVLGVPANARLLGSHQVLAPGGVVVKQLDRQPIAAAVDG